MVIISILEKNYFIFKSSSNFISTKDLRRLIIDSYYFLFIIKVFMCHFHKENSKFRFIENINKENGNQI